MNRVINESGRPGYIPVRGGVPAILFLCCILFFPVGVHAEEVLSWEDCVREAAKNHPDLISAREDIKVKESARAIAASGLFPQASGDLSASTSKSGSRTTDTYGYGVSASQLVFDGFKTPANVKAGAENIKVARYTYEFASAEVRLRLRTAFIHLWGAQELLHITREISKIRRDNLVLISLRYESGLEHKGALLTAEANVAQANFEVSQAERNLVVAQQNLVLEMGRAAFSPVCVSQDLKLDEAEKEKPNFEKIAAEHPSLKKLAAQTTVASLNVDAAKAEFFPTVTASTAVDKSGAHWPAETGRWDTGVSLSLPLFEGGRRLAQVSQAKALFNKAQADEHSGKGAIMISLEQAWASLQDAVDLVGVREKSLEATQARAKIAESQYALGLIQFDSWIIIEDDLVLAKKTYLDAQAGALLAQANWVQAKGEVLEHAHH